MKVIPVCEIRRFGLRLGSVPVSTSQAYIGRYTRRLFDGEYGFRNDGALGHFVGLAKEHAHKQDQVRLRHFSGPMDPMLEGIILQPNSVTDSIRSANLAEFISKAPF